MNAPQVPMPEYRPDIDGLRAVSVIAVILFHAGVPVMPGGFIGVDVFFVVSGFLITRLLMDRPQGGVKMRLGEFYLRRARRILPALLVVIWATALGAWMLYSPAELKGFGRFAATAAALLANLTAGSAGGYFDSPWAITPLLHLWSIAVEEQFYLLYPLALLAVQRALPVRWRLPVIALGTCLSFTLCVWGAETHPVRNYYATPTRAWELLFGALLALGAIRPPARRELAEVLAVVAFGALMAACLLFDRDVTYPGYNTLVPVLSTGTLILTGRDGQQPWINRVLAQRPLVFIGLISYSMYLWHVPVLALFAYFFVEPATATQTACLLALIALLSVATWAGVERPLRARRWLRGNGTFVGAALACSVITIVAGLLLWRSDGFPERFPSQVQRMIDPLRLFGSSGSRCMGLPPAKIDADELCESGITKDPARTVLLWGDSHAWALLPALEHLAARRNSRLWFSAWSACRPLIDVEAGLLSAQSRAECAEFNSAMVRAVRRLEPDLLIVHAYWQYGDPPGVSGEVVARGLRGLQRELGGAARQVCIVQGVPLFPYSVPHALAMAELRGLERGLLDVSRASAEARQAPVDAVIRDFATARGWRSFDPKQVLCADGSCRSQSADGMPLYRDGSHLSVEGARYLAPDLATCFR